MEYMAIMESDTSDKKKTDDELKKEIFAHIREIQSNVRKLNKQVKMQMKEKKYREAKQTISKMKKELLKLKTFIEKSPDKYFYNIMKSIVLIISITAGVAIGGFKVLQKELTPDKFRIETQKYNIDMYNSWRKDNIRKRTAIQSKKEETIKHLSKRKEEYEKLKKEIEEPEDKLTSMDAKSSVLFSKIHAKQSLNKDGSYDNEIRELEKEWRELNTEIKKLNKELEPSQEKIKKVHGEIQDDLWDLVDYDRDIKSSRTRQAENKKEIDESIKKNSNISAESKKHKKEINKK